MIAGRYPLVRKGLRSVISADPGLDAVGEAGTGREAVALALALCPDVVVLESGLPELGWADATRRIRGALPQTEVMILVTPGSEEAARRALGVGARGFVLMSDRTSRVLEGIRSLARHKMFFTGAAEEVIRIGSSQTDASTRAILPSDLSPREREILRLLADGRTTKETAQELGISPKTVEVHRGSLMKKLDIHSMARLVRYAIRNSVIEV